MAMSGHERMCVAMRGGDVCEFGGRMWLRGEFCGFGECMWL